MCGTWHKKQATNNERSEIPEGSYEGDTVRLSTHQQDQGLHPLRSVHRKHDHHNGFPWWTLWLIWPLFGVVKEIVTAFGASIAAVVNALPTHTFSVSAIIPILLIVVGVLLLRRQ